MTDSFKVTGTVTPANPSTGDTVTLTISGDDVHTTWAPGRLTIIDPVTLTDGKPAALVAQSWSPYVAANTAPPVVTRYGASVSYTWAHG